MSNFAKKYKVQTNPFTFKTPETHEYKKCADVVAEYTLNKIHTVRAFYINNKGAYGDEPVIVTDDFILNAPSHVLSIVQDVLTDSESINEINNGEVHFLIYEYQNKYGLQHSVAWVDSLGDEPHPAA